MTSIKNKAPVARTGGDNKKKDVPEGTTEIQIKEEPADMEEYLKSSNSVIQAPGKMQVSATSSTTSSSSNQAQLATPGKNASAQVKGPAAATTPKPGVGAVTRSQAQNLVSLATPKAVPSINAVKMPVSGTKDTSSSLTTLPKSTTPASAANGKPALGNLKSTTVAPIVKGVLPPRNSLSVGPAKLGVAISTSAGAVSADPKAKMTLQHGSPAVGNPSKAPVTIVAQKDGASSQVKSGSVTLLTTSRVVSASALQKTTLLPSNPKAPAATVEGVVVQNKAKDAKVVVSLPTPAASSSTTVKQLRIETVPDVTNSSEYVALHQPLSHRQTSLDAVAKTDQVVAPGPDAISWPGQNTDEYAGSYESGCSDILGILAHPDEETHVNSSVSNEDCAVDLEITIKMEPPDDYPDDTAMTPAQVAMKTIGSSNANQSDIPIACSPRPAAPIQTGHSGSAVEAATCVRDTIIVSSGASSSASLAGLDASVGAKASSSVLVGSKSAPRLSGISNPTSNQKVASSVCSESKADSSALSNKKISAVSAGTKISVTGTKVSLAAGTKTSSAAATVTSSAAATVTSSTAAAITLAAAVATASPAAVAKTSSAAATKTPLAVATETSLAAAGIAGLPAGEIDESIVKVEPMDIEEAVASSESVSRAIDETSDAEPSSRTALADTLQSMGLAAAALHAVPPSSVLGEDAEEQVSVTTSSTLPDHSRTRDDQTQDSLEIVAVDMHLVEISVSNQMEDGSNERHSGTDKTTGDTMTTESDSQAEPNFATSAIVELADNDEDMENEAHANMSKSPAEQSGASSTADPDEASLLFSGFSDLVPGGNVSTNNQVYDLPIKLAKSVEMMLRDLNHSEDVVCRSSLEASPVARVGVSAERAHQTQTPSPAKNSKDTQLEQLGEHSVVATSTRSATALGGAQMEKEIVKRVARLMQQDKSKRLAGAEPKDDPVAPPAKRSRVMTPVTGKENAGMTGMQSKSDRNKSSSQRITRQKILTPCTSQRQSVERKHFKKHPIGKVSDDLWMETSSFLDEDLRSELESSEPVYVFEPRNRKQRTVLRTAEKGKLHGSSKSGKSFINQTNRGRIVRKQLNVHFRSARHVRFPFLSQLVKRFADRCCWDWNSCQVEDISAGQRQDLLSDLNCVYLGKQPRFLLKPMGHLDGLSLETQLESQLLDFHSVRIIFLEVARDWVRRKPLHLFMTGQLKIEPRTYMPPKRTSRTNTTFENCQKAFCRDICFILADVCNYEELDDCLFQLPDGVSQFTADRVFRKVKQYLRNYVERLMRTIVAERDSMNSARLFDEADRRNFKAKIKSKQRLKESGMIRLPVCENVLLGEPESVYQGTGDARTGDAALDDSAVHETVLHGPSKRLSSELCLPVQNSLDAAFDLFSKEAENICQGTIETHVVSDDDVVNDDACTVVDSSKLYSPTRPTDVEELGIEVLENEEAAEAVTAVAVIKETRLGDEALNIISGKVLGKPLLNEKIFPEEKALLPKNVHVEEAEEGEIVNIVDQEKISSSSLVADTFRRKKLRSSVASRTAVESAHAPSSKRRKRSKTSREKKTKRRKDKRKSQSHLNSEKDRGHKRKKFKHSNESRVEQKRQVASQEIIETSRPEPARICLASPSDSVYCDSYTTMVKDVLSSVPISNFDDSFDPLLPSSDHYRNPYRISWPLIEYFVNRDVNMLSKLIGIIPDVKTFRTRLVRPANSFLWSLVLALFDSTTQIQIEAKLACETEEMGQNVLNQNFKPVSDDLMEFGSTSEDLVKKLSVKGNNPLMQAFRQVVEAKRRLSRETQKSKPLSSITKLSAELAALRAAPKSAKPLFKPTSNNETQSTLKISDPHGSRVPDTVSRCAQLASEALFQLYNEMKMLLNEQEDTVSVETGESDLSCIELPTAGCHLGGLSSLVFSLYENYERLSKISEETDLSRPASEMDECITIVDDSDSFTDNKMDEDNSDVYADLQADDAVDLEKLHTAPEKSSQKLFDLSDEEVSVSLYPEFPVSKEAENAVGSGTSLVAEKEAAKVVLSTAPAMPPAPIDRQYISSFPPVGVIKKKSKAISQTPRMIFSKLIGPSLEERLSSTSSIPVPQSPQDSAQQPSSAIATSSPQLSSVVVSSSLTLTTDISVNIDQAQDICETNQSSAARSASLSTLVGKPVLLPSSSNFSSCKDSSKNDAPANVKTLSTEQQQSVISSTASDVAVIGTKATSSATTTPIQSSAAVAATVVASVSAAGLQVPVPSSASFDEMSYSATFPPIPPEKLSSQSSLAQPPLPLGEADMLPPPLPPMTLSEMATSDSNTFASDSNSAYYSGYFSSLSSSNQSQVFSTASTGYDVYAGGSFDPAQSWMYDPNMYPTSNQTPMLDPSLMAYPPPLQPEPMSFYLQPTNQPPPFLPAAPGSQIFPAYPSGQSVPPSSLPYLQNSGQLPGTFSYPPPNLPPPTIPHPTIPPPTIPHPSIPPPSIPPPSIYPSAAPFQTSMPPPAVVPYNMYGPQWTPDASSQYLSSDYYSQTTGSASLATMPSGSAPVSVPPPVLDGQQGSLLPEALSSIHDMVKYPPPVVPGSSMPNSSIPELQDQNTKQDHETDLSMEKDQSAQFSSKSSDSFNYAEPPFKNKAQDTYPEVSSSNESRFSGLEQSREFEMIDHDSYVKPASQKSNRTLSSSELETGFSSVNQSWDSLNMPHDGVSGSWESMNAGIEESWPSQSKQSIVEQGPSRQQQRPAGPLLQTPKDTSMNIQQRKRPLQDQEQMHDSLQRQPQGASGLDQRRHEVPRHLQPGSEPRQLLRHSVPPLLRQPVPESRQPGSQLRQPAPEHRHAAPRPRQPGPLPRQPGPEQKQAGQSLRQPGKSEQRPALQPRHSNPAGHEQKLKGPQSRPCGPQQRLNGPEQGQSGSHAPERRLLGPQAVGLQAGPKTVAPLMAVPIRRSLDGATNQSAKHDKPGHVAPQGPLSNTRFFVFNTDRSACATAEHLLLCSGAQKFDPYNINALRVMPEIRCLLLVHKEDLKHVQRIPSLLRLKRDLRVSFVMFGDASDIHQKRLVAFFPRAGTMIMDLTALLACKSDVLDGMCQFMTQQTVEKRTSWKLMLPSNVFNAIDFLKYKYEDEPEEHVRLAEVSQILATYKTSGIVEFLPENPYRGQPRTTVEYQASCVALQISRLGSYRHFLFVSDMPRNHPDANLFLNNGIDILSIPEFMRCFVSRQVEHQPKLHPPYITRVTMKRFHDAVISNGTECIAI